MKTVEETRTNIIYQSEVLQNVRTTDPSFARAIEWADEHPVLWRIVTGSKSKAFGLGSCEYIGWAQRSMETDAILERARHLYELAEGRSPFHNPDSIFVWRAIFTIEHFQDKGFTGGFNAHLPEIVGILSSLRTELTSIFLFSNKVVEVPFKTLLAGKVQTTYGTDFDCIADSILERNMDKAIVITDGYASISADKQVELKNRKLQALTILFGGKTDCSEFEPFGDVVQLDDITN